MTPPVFFIEDDDVDWSIMEASLKKLNYRTYRRFENAVEFKEAVIRGELECGVVLSDMNLPLMSGQELLQWIRSRSDSHQWVVILLTSNDAARSILESYSQGANAYVIKPFDLQEMATVLIQIMDFWTRTVALPFKFDQAV